jgi:hypothetical protein
MHPRISVPKALLAALPLVLALAAPTVALAQASPPPAAAPSAAAAKSFSQQDLDQILAPIALYPDALVAQILMASTYPLEVVEAARWSAANPKVTDKALEDAMQKQPWDPSVKSLTAVPQVLKQMNDNLSLTQKLGDAFLADQAAVLTTVQNLRAKAQAAGNLKSTPEQTVKTEQESGKTVYVIESAKPEVVYVPAYNPATIYGPWWYPSYPPYYMYPPGYAYAPGLAFATGVVVGAAIWGNCNWGGNNVNVNVNNYNRYNKTNVSNGNWNHSAEHRKGVNYRDNATAQKYNRGGDAKAVQSREQFRGQAEQGRAEMAGMDKSQLQNRTQQADRSSAANRASTSDRSSAGNRASTSDRSGGGSASHGGGGGGGFSGAGSGASTRQASSRGSSSRASAGGGGARGGGGGGRGGGGRR